MQHLVESLIGGPLENPMERAGSSQKGGVEAHNQRQAGSKSSIIETLGPGGPGEKASNGVIVRVLLDAGTS